MGFHADRATEAGMGWEKMAHEWMDMKDWENKTEEENQPEGSGSE